MGEAYSVSEEVGDVSDGEIHVEIYVEGERSEMGSDGC